jgi:hypothetical protein
MSGGDEIPSVIQIEEFAHTQVYIAFTRHMEEAPIWQFRWPEKTTDESRSIDGTIDQIPDLETARKAEGGPGNFRPLGCASLHGNQYKRLNAD